MVDDNAYNLRFVEVIRRHPCLYDFTRPDYSKREAIDAAWSDVSSEMNLTVSQSKEKWRNLRTALTRSLKIKTKQSPGRGLILSRQNKEYYMKDAMQFLLPFLKSKGPDCGPFIGLTESELLHDHSNDHEHEQESAGSEYDPNRFEDFSPSQYPSSSMENPLKRSFEGAQSEDESKERFEIREPPRKLPSYANHPHPSPGKWFNHSRGPVPCSSPAFSPEDSPDLHFLKSLLPDLSKMNDYQKRQFKLRTLNVIDSILCDSPSSNAIIKEDVNT